MADKPKIHWAKVDPDTFPPKARKLYDAWQEAQKAASAAREAMLDELTVAAQKSAPDGMEARFATRFGLSVAFAAPGVWEAHYGSKSKGKGAVSIY